MATKSSFKQQCPSCEAMVPIRDPKLIGRKIDCPKCKYRFVVEEPEEEAEEVETPAGKTGGSNGVTNKKPAGGKAPAKPATRRDDDDDAEDAKPKKKQGGSSAILIVGIGLAAVAVVALAIGGWLLFGGDSGNTKSKSSGTPMANNAAPPTNPDETKEQKQQEKKDDKPRPRMADVTNLLPNDTHMVVNLAMDPLLSNATFKKATLQTPGSFNEAAFLRTWGISPTAVSRVLLGFNFDKKSVFSVMRTAKPINMDQFVAARKLKAEAPVGGLNYYLLKQPLDSLSTLLLKGNLSRDKVALHFVDGFTVVCADVGPMKQFLEAKGQPKQLSKPPEPEQLEGSGSTGGAPTGAPAGAPGGMYGGSPNSPGGPPGAGGPPGSPPAGGSGSPPGMTPGAPGTPPSGSGSPPGAPPSGAPASPPNGPPSGASGGYRPPGMPGGMYGGSGGMYPGSGGSASSDSIAAPVSTSYMTIEPDLKSVLDQVEKVDKKEGQAVLLSVAVSSSGINVDHVKTIIAQSPEAKQVPDFVLKLGLDQFKRELKAAGFALTDLSDTKVAAAAGVSVKDSKMASAWEKEWSTAIAAQVAALGMDILPKSGGQQNQNRGGGMYGGPPGGMYGGSPSGGPPGGGMAGMYPPGMSPSGPSSPPRGGPPGGMAGMYPPGMSPSGPSGSPNFPPGMQPPGSEDEKKEETKAKDGEYQVWSKDRVVALGGHLTIKSEQYMQATLALDELSKMLKGVADLSINRWRIHELAAATQAYLQKEGRFPPGTLPRKTTQQHPFDWRPDQRLSWMVDLLPYVANGEFASLPIEKDNSWNESGNVLMATTVVPAFLAPQPADKLLPQYYVPYPGLKGFLPAETNYVGIAGVGLDAAEYRAGDAETAKQRGIFGYSRTTKPDEIKDGAENTILLIQVPAAPKSPWMAGGGSTVRGVSPDNDCVQPFVCTEYEGKPGTFAIMADGKVRFIPASIDPKTFQAMCTIAGGEKIKDINAVAPEVPAPDEDGQTELKAEQSAQPAATPPAQPTNPPGGAEAAPVDARTKALRSNHLKQLGLAYHNYVDTNGKSPSKVEDLAPFFDNNARIVAAVKDGTFVIFWNAPPFQKMTAGTSNTILGHEKDTPTKGGLVLMADGSVKDMSEKEFKDAAKATGK